MEICRTIVALFFSLTLVIGILGKPPKKIVGGTYSTPDEFPYQISIRIYGQHFCGGSIISTRHIVTAAHCLIDKMHLYNQIVIVSGTTNLYFGGNFHPIESVKLHPAFINDATYVFANDIAVVTLSTPIKIDHSNHIIKLASKSDYGGLQGVVSGWGYTAHNGGRPFPYLLKLTTNVVNATWCQQYMKRPLYNSQVCALSSSTSGTCQGDSGGPLAVGNELVGIVSFGILCGSGEPDVYTSVYSYRKFIEEAINESGLSNDILYPSVKNNNVNNGKKILSKVANPVSSTDADAHKIQQNNKAYYLFKNGEWLQVKYQ